MCKDILTVVVGSNLHGLAREGSDIDLRGVFINDIADIVNPFEKPPEKRFIEGQTTDDTSSELRKFVREVVAGNPNSIEVLFSNMVTQETIEGAFLRANRDKFIDTQAVFDAYKNYAANQLNKMNLFVPDARTPKFAVAYIRSLLNGVELLRDGRITNPVPLTFPLTDGTVIRPADVLVRVKFTPFEQFETVREEATRMFTILQIELGKVFYSSKPKQADREWIVKFVREAYGV